MSMVKNLIQKRSDELASSDLDSLLDDAAERHDLKAALRDLKMLSAFIREGYKFDDEMASDHIEGMQKAITVLDTFFGKYFESKNSSKSKV